jgi:hypothetical protein|tara:strand:- start:425 stop:682 length:258 start_codon:yes stop_codon:yes gene_type:complete
MKHDRCAIQLLDANDLERAIDNPALAALVGGGWSVMANLVVETPQGNKIALLMAPPIKQKGMRTIVVTLVLAFALQTASLAWILS